MNIFEKILYFLQGEMTEPQAYGWFHFMCLGIAFVVIFILYKKRKSHNEKEM